jgi:hypothetical protein
MSSTGKRVFRVMMALGLTLQLGCASDRPVAMSPAERKVIADSLEKLVTNTYDLRAPDFVGRLMSLYPPAGPVYSTSSGHITTSRDSLQSQIETFWKYVGSNMRNPKWEWTAMDIDVLAPDAAVMTTAYRVPHMTPMNMEHVIAGAWTAVFVNRGGRWVVTHEHLSDVPAAIADSAARRQMQQMSH